MNWWQSRILLPKVIIIASFIYPNNILIWYFHNSLWSFLLKWKKKLIHDYFQKWCADQGKHGSIRIHNFSRAKIILLVFFELYKKALRKLKLIAFPPIIDQLIFINRYEFQIYPYEKKLLHWDRTLATKFLTIQILPYSSNLTTFLTTLMATFYYWTATFLFIFKQIYGYITGNYRNLLIDYKIFIQLKLSQAVSRET